jgi:hypothetical protein
LFVGTGRVELPADVLGFLVAITRRRVNSFTIRADAARLLTEYQ